MSHHDHPHTEEQEAEQPTATPDLATKAAEYLAGWQRAQADYQNLKRQTDKEKQEMGSFVRAAMLVQLVPMLENFRRAFQHVPEDQRSAEWVVGLQHVQKQIEDLLTQNGLTEIPAKDEQFDPMLHEAVAKEKKEGIASGTILDVLQSGWKLEGNVVVPSKVTVAE